MEIAAGLVPTPGYRYAERAGDELFVAGQVPLDARGDVVGAGEAGVQATRCLDNLATLLGLHGFGRSDVRHLTISVVGERPHLIQAWTAVRGWWEPTPVPPATLIGVHALGHEGQLVEVDARIVRHDGGRTDGTRR